MDSFCTVLFDELKDACRHLIFSKECLLRNLEKCDKTSCPMVRKATKSRWITGAKELLNGEGK